MAGTNYVSKAATLLRKYPKLMPWIVATLKYADFPRVAGDDTSELIVFLKWYLDGRLEGTGAIIQSIRPTYSMVGCSGCGDVVIDRSPAGDPQYLVVPLCNRCYGKPRGKYFHWTLSNLKLFKEYGGHLNAD